MPPIIRCQVSLNAVNAGFDLMRALLNQFTWTSLKAHLARTYGREVDLSSWIEVKVCRCFLFPLRSDRALHGQRAEGVPPAHEGLAEERPGDSVRARRGQQPADREAEAQGESSLWRKTQLQPTSLVAACKV